MKTIIMLVLCLPVLVYADKYKVPDHHQNQGQQQDQRQSQWLENQLNAFNEQVNRQEVIAPPTCYASLGNVQIGNASHSVASWCVSAFKVPGVARGGVIGFSAPIVSSKVKTALDNEADRIAKDKTDREEVQRLLKLIEEQQRQINWLGKQVNDKQDKVEEK